MIKFVKIQNYSKQIERADNQLDKFVKKSAEKTLKAKNLIKTLEVKNQVKKKKILLLKKRFSHFEIQFKKRTKNKGDISET